MRAEDAVEMTTPAAAPVCPYRGPAVFQTEDSGWFFGRTQLVGKLVSRLHDRATLVVAGPSQCGKSSLVRAGLLPALARGDLPGSAGPQSVFVPGSHPLDALWGALGRLSGEPLPDIFSLEEAPGTAATRFVREGVLIVDQFETVFTAASDLAERGAFLSLLEALDSEQRVRIILCIGTEFYGSCSAVPWLASAISENHVLVGRPSDEGLREVIEGPARRGGLRLEEGLADRMVDDVRSDPTPLATLSAALRETWNRRKGRILTIEGYEQALELTKAASLAEVDPPRATRKTAAAPTPAPPPPSVPASRPSSGAQRVASRRVAPILVALFLLALLASLALAILLTQAAH
jgi:hypothetical protein